MIKEKKKITDVLINLAKGKSVKEVSENFHIPTFIIYEWQKKYRTNLKMLTKEIQVSKEINRIMSIDLNQALA